MDHKGMNRLQAHLCLLCVTACWASEGLIFSYLPDSIPASGAMCITYFIGAFLLMLAFHKRVFSEYRSGRSQFLLSGFMLAALNLTLNTLYLRGYQTIDIAHGAMLITLTMGFLPPAMIILRKKVDGKTWLAAALAVAGVLIGLIGFEVTSLSLTGMSFFIMGSLVRAFYIVKMNDFSKKYDSVSLSVLIAIFAGIISYFVWFSENPETFMAVTWSRPMLASLFTYSYFLIAFAQSLNLFAHRRATPAGATVIYSLELPLTVIIGLIVPAAIASPFDLTTNMIIGILFVIAGSLVELIRPEENGKGGTAA